MTLACAAAAVIAGTADASEYVTNSGFDTLAGGVAYGDDVLVTSDYGNSAAANWPIYNFSASTGGTTTTELLATFGGRSNVLHITSDGGGIYQMIGGGSGHYGYADVFVVTGAARFYMCSGYCGGNNYNVASSITGSWERLTLFGAGYVDEVSLYATPGPAEFYVDTLSVGDERPPVLDVPEPATWMMMLAGFGLIGAALRSRKVRFAWG